MGMYCTLHRATDEDIERLLAEPDSVRDFLHPDRGGPRVREVRPKGILGFLIRFTPVKITEVDPDDDTPYVPPDPEGVLDVGKGWHGLHFLFTGTAAEGDEPADFLMRGGEPLDDDGFGRAFRAPQVQRLARFLESLSTPDLARRYDPRRMTELEIYPDDAWTRDRQGADPLQWLLECYGNVRDFVVRAAQARDGVIVDTS